MSLQFVAWLRSMPETGGETVLKKAVWVAKASETNGFFQQGTSEGIEAHTRSRGGASGESFAAPPTRRVGRNNEGEVIRD